MFMSNHTPPLVTLLTMTGQKPEDYKLVKANNAAGWNVAYVAGSEADETAAVERFKKWYGE
jgi:hypothetical protein